MLANSRVDAIIGPLVPIKGAAKRLNLGDDFFGEPMIVSQRTPWLQASNKSLDKLDISALSSKFKKLIASGTHEELFKKY